MRGEEEGEGGEEGGQVALGDPLGEGHLLAAEERVGVEHGERVAGVGDLGLVGHSDGDAEGDGVAPGQGERGAALDIEAVGQAVGYAPSEGGQVGAARGDCRFYVERRVVGHVGQGSGGQVGGGWGAL